MDSPFWLFRAAIYILIAVIVVIGMLKRVRAMPFFALMLLAMVTDWYRETYLRNTPSATTIEIVCGIMFFAGFGGWMYIWFRTDTSKNNEQP